jgi:formylglycine-generating enzyme required for sulfatase activity
MSAEKCDGKDNDCDGTIDDGAPDTWVPITVAGQNRWIYKFEASRPDATAVAQGTQSARSCSNPNVLPWTNVTFGQAEAACTAAGGALCSEAEWQAACQSSTNNCAWGMDSCSTYGATKCNGNDFDSDSGTAGDQDALRTTQSMSACYANWGSTTNRVFDMSGNVKEWTLSGAGDPANTRRLRGGSYNNTSGGLRCDFRFAVADSTFQFPNVGFRCCRSTPP